ncbi:hypothetical protein L596_018050 [Steinernema carpocapsae]|uniref:Carbohydrate kinase FGGY N-terminal domain-containing protein n=1 Tax=Steinernema carpocapsae TaxID=34508 RepID=A0A4U5N3H3_STECR|nr:hypothetical protein L596_018050 [Steinernema carpocapsae]
MHTVGIDIGTTSLKLSVVDNTRQNIISKSELHKAEISISGHLDWHEQDPKKILEALDGLLEGLDWSKVTRACVSGQMHGIVVWDEETLETKTNLVTWMDARCSKEFLETLPKWPHSTMATGFGCATLAWLRKHGRLPENGRFRAGTIMDYVVAKKTGRPKVPMSILNAYGFGLCEGKEWILKDPILPEIVAPETIVGKWLGTEAEVLVASADLQTTLLPYIREGVAVLNVGTSSQLCFLLPEGDEKKPMPTGVRVVPFYVGRWLALAASLNGGNVIDLVTKTIVRWSSQLTGAPSSPLHIDFARINEFLEDESNDDSQRLSINSRFFGERHDTQSGATVTNWNETTTLKHFIRSVAVGVIDNLVSMLSEGELFKSGITTLCLTGRASQGVFQKAIERNFPKMRIESSSEKVSAAFGAALQALEASEKG